MKLRTFLFCLILLVLSSCNFMESFDDRAYVGIGIDIVNVTNTEFENVKLHVGGIKDVMWHNPTTTIKLFY